MLQRIWFWIQGRIQSWLLGGWARSIAPMFEKPKKPGDK